MIDDPELAGLFRDEADEHLQRLEEGLLRLEQSPRDAETLDEVLREAHSLKGASRMLGLADVELLSHALEDRLRAATKGSIPLGPGDVESLLLGVDALRGLCREALDDTPADVEVTAVLETLRGRGEAAPPPVVAPPSVVATPEPVAQPVAIVESVANVEPVVSEAAAVAHASQARIQTVRVEPRKLDMLMSQVGELTVATTRVAHRLGDVSAAIRQWEALYQRQRADRWAMSMHGGEQTPASEAELAAAWEQAESQLRDIGSALRGLHDDLADDAARLGSVVGKVDEGIREIRMLPLSTIFDQFHRMTRDISRSLGKQVTLVVEGGDTLADKQILEEMKDPLMHLIRNAIHHGIEAPDERVAAGKLPVGTITLSGRLVGSSIELAVADDGRGLDTERIRAKVVTMGLHTGEELADLPPDRVWQFIFASGMSTASTVTDISGRGVGMDVVRSNVDALKGRISISSRAGEGATFTCLLPQTLATTRVLLVRVSGQVFGIPLEFLTLASRIRPTDLYPVDGRTTLTVAGTPVSAAYAADLLELSRHVGDDGPLTCVLVTDGSDQLALLVDQAVEEQELVLKPIGALLRRVRNVTGAGILSSGEVCVVLNAPDLVRTVRSGGHLARPAARPARQQRVRTVLVAEDSATTRAQVKRILESAGYRVIAAVDGQDAWEQIATQQVDAVVSDVLMPRMTGFELAEHIRGTERWRDLPIILVTTLATDEDRRRGLQVGANAYIVKGAFEQSALLDAVASFIGGRRSDD